jgi:hypothetical protein
MMNTLILLAAMLVPAQEFEFKGSGWVNSRDLNLERLRGKVVVLHFFEEG